MEPQQSVAREDLATTTVTSATARVQTAAVISPDIARTPTMALSQPRAGEGEAREPAQLRPGARIGQYELIRELGRGGMGTVYLARDTKLGRRVAIKVLHTDKPEVTARFILEARATARCNHENIVVIHEVGEHDDQPFMVLEYLHGTPLSKVIENGRKLAPNRAVELILPVVRALVSAHEHNIVHRDLKPDNIFVTESGTVKVLDFGIAKLMQGHLSPDATIDVATDAATDAANGILIDASCSDNASPNYHEMHSRDMTQRGALIGTLPYMSPEQWGADTVDHRTDIWAVGIMLYRMVTGQHPLASAQGRQFMITGIVTVPMPTVHSACPEIPDALAGIIDHCLRKPRDQRIGSARELYDRLAPLVPGRHLTRLEADANPYAGLNAFQEADANRFFGRAREIATAVSRLRDRPLLGVVGVSGVGKSSFVRAGVVPALKHSGDPWTVLVIRPGRHPMAALAHAMTPMVTQATGPPTTGPATNQATGPATNQAAGPATNQTTGQATGPATGQATGPATGQATKTIAGDLSEHSAVVERLYTEPGYLGTLLRQRARRRGEHILVFVDQFEEIYTLVADEHERLAFTRCLACLADDATTPLRVVISLRSDFLDRVPEDEHFLAELTPGLFFLSPPSRDGLRDALAQPAEMAGYEFENPAIVEHMLDHLAHTPGALPLLQFAASQLWDRRDPQRRLLSAASYRAIGGIAGALASHADAVLAELPAAARALAQTLFMRLITPERTRAVVPMDELYHLAANPDRMQQLLEHLVHARLLVVQSGAETAAGHSAAVEIVHESLIHSWPFLRRLLDENQEDAAVLEQLRTAAKQWQAKGRPNGLLWRGEALEDARRWYRHYRGQLAERQQAFLHAAFALAKRTARRGHIAVAGIIVFLSLLVAAAAVALVLIGEAQQEATAQARAATTAERALRHQYTALEQALTRQMQAEQRTLTALDETKRAKDEVAESRAALAASNEELHAALQRTRQAMRRATRSRAHAQNNAAAARLAETQARLAMEELQRLLEQEQQRVVQLESEVINLIEDVSLRE